MNSKSRNKVVEALTEAFADSFTGPIYTWFVVWVFLAVVALFS